MSRIFHPEALFTGAGFVLAVRTLRSRKTLFGRKELELEALLFLSTDTIDFQRYLDCLQKGTGGGEQARISCAWLVCSERGGIYLHEAISTRENKKRNGVRSRFAVINSCDGGISFGPGHPANPGATRMMRDCLEELRVAPGPANERRLQDLLERFFETCRGGA